MNTLLSSTFFGPVQWYSHLHRAERALIEHCDSYQKQTYRNRCLIAATGGVQALTVPVERPDGGRHGTLMKDLLISDHGDWRRLHRNALASAYGESPFFEYYADDILPFFEPRWKYLYDLNMESCLTVCRLLDIRPDVSLTTEFTPPADGHLIISGRPYTDLREAIRPKHPLPDPAFTARPYYQVYAAKHGFLPNLSILDLLFNMGPEGIFYL